MIAAAFSLAGCGLNSVPTAEEQVNAEFANLQAEYQRRNDLIGNLVETVKAAGSTSLTRPARGRSPPHSCTLTSLAGRMRTASAESTFAL